MSPSYTQPRSNNASKRRKEQGQSPCLKSLEKHGLRGYHDTYSTHNNARMTNILRTPHPNDYDNADSDFEHLAQLRELTLPFLSNQYRFIVTNPLICVNLFFKYGLLF